MELWFGQAAWCKYCVFINHLEATVSFNQSLYSIEENEGPAQLVLVLSYPSSTDITVTITDNGSTAMGK